MKMNGKSNGLGLYISKSICKALGGDLVCESSLGLGSTFILTIAMRRINDQLKVNDLDSNLLVN